MTFGVKPLNIAREAWNTGSKILICASGNITTFDTKTARRPQNNETCMICKPTLEIKDAKWLIISKYFLTVVKCIHTWYTPYFMQSIQRERCMRSLFRFGWCFWHMSVLSISVRVTSPMPAKWTWSIPTVGVKRKVGYLNLQGVG